MLLWLLVAVLFAALVVFINLARTATEVAEKYHDANLELQSQVALMQDRPDIRSMSLSDMDAILNPVDGEVS